MNIDGKNKILDDIAKRFAEEKRNGTLNLWLIHHQISTGLQCSLGEAVDYIDEMERIAKSKYE